VYRFLLAACLLFPAFGEIPSSVMAEDNLEKRSDLALKEAETQLSAATKAYSSGPDLKAFGTHIEAVGDLAQLSLKSLQDSGKRARKSPKYFKRAELKLRSLLRRLETLEREVLAEDRPPVEATKSLVSTAHEQILSDIMSKR
jgi:hypothetical protein